MELDRKAFACRISDEIGQLKAQINDLYVALLELRMIRGQELDYKV